MSQHDISGSHSYNPLMPTPRKNHPFSLSRRAWFKSILGTLFLFPLFQARTDEKPAIEKPASLRGFVDTIMPEDDSPSASDLGVDDKIWEEAMRQRSSARLVWMGCAWLDRECQQRWQTDFGQLDEPRRIEMVEACEQAPARSLERTFFRYCREKTFEHYYTDRRAWATLAYAGPPQPAGFVNHDKPL